MKIEKTWYFEVDTYTKIKINENSNYKHKNVLNKNAF